MFSNDQLIVLILEQCEQINFLDGRFSYKQIKIQRQIPEWIKRQMRIMQDQKLLIPDPEHQDYYVGLTAKAYDLLRDSNKTWWQKTGKLLLVELIRLLAYGGIFAVVFQKFLN